MNLGSTSWCQMRRHPERNSVRKRPVRPGFGSAWAGLGFGRSQPGGTMGCSPASEAHLTGPGRTADICRLSSDRM